MKRSAVAQDIPPALAIYFMSQTATCLVDDGCEPLSAAGMIAVTRFRKNWEWANHANHANQG